MGHADDVGAESRRRLQSALVCVSSLSRVGGGTAVLVDRHALGQRDGETLPELEIGAHECGGPRSITSGSPSIGKPKAIGSVPRAALAPSKSTDTLVSLSTQLTRQARTRVKGQARP